MRVALRLITYARLQAVRGTRANQIKECQEDAKKVGGAIVKSGTFMTAKRGFGSQVANRINAIEHTPGYLYGNYSNRIKSTCWIYAN